MDAAGRCGEWQGGRRGVAEPRRDPRDGGLGARKFVPAGVTYDTYALPHSEESCVFKTAIAKKTDCVNLNPSARARGPIFYEKG